jgi:CubicO group peptidase (beta-lactamase class C family)
MRQLYCSFFLLVASLMLHSQDVRWSLESFEKASLEVLCLQNEGDLLPIRDLAKIDIGYRYFGRDGKHYFEETLDYYMPILNLGTRSGKLKFNTSEKSKVLICAVNAEFFDGLKNDNRAEMLTFLSEMDTDLPKVLVVFGGTEVPQLERLKPVFDVLIYTPMETYWYQSLVAQVIFGGITIDNKAPVDLSDSFQKGAGVRVEAMNRFAYVPPGAAGMDGQLLQDSIKAIVESGIQAGAFPGAQVLVAKDGQVVYHETFGFHTYDSLAPVRKHDLYDFASVSKITSALPAIMKWSGEDKFDIDAPLKAYFPAFARSNKASLSYRSMLAHNARLMPWIPYWRSTLKGCAKYPWKRRWRNDNFNNGKFKKNTFTRDSSDTFNVFVTEDLWLHKDYKEKRIYKAIRKSPLNEKQEYKYSGLLFYLLPEIVAQRSGMDYEKYLKETFYEPLGAYTLTFNPSRFFPKSRIIPTERDTFFRLTALHGTVHDEGASMMGGFSANAGLFGTAGDLAKLMQMYMNYGSFGGKRLIAEKALKEFTKCQYCAEGNRRGLGFDKPLIEYDPEASSVARDASPASFGHSGYTGTFTWADPESGLLFIFFSNRVYPTRFNSKIYEMGIRPRIHQVLYDAVEE